MAKALAKLIATPAGQRPDRVIVGAGYGADAVNAAVRPIQAQMISGIGFDALTKLRRSVNGVAETYFVAGSHHGPVRREMGKLDRRFEPLPKCKSDKSAIEMRNPNESQIEK